MKKSLCFDLIPMLVSFPKLVLDCNLSSLFFHVGIKIIFFDLKCNEYDASFMTLVCNIVPKKRYMLKCIYLYVFFMDFSQEYGDLKKLFLNYRRRKSYSKYMIVFAR